MPNGIFSDRLFSNWLNKISCDAKALDCLPVKGTALLLFLAGFATCRVLGSRIASSLTELGEKRPIRTPLWPTRTSPVNEPHKVPWSAQKINGVVGGSTWLEDGYWVTQET